MRDGRDLVNKGDGIQLYVDISSTKACVRCWISSQTASTYPGAPIMLNKDTRSTVEKSKETQNCLAKFFLSAALY